MFPGIPIASLAGWKGDRAMQKRKSPAKNSKRKSRSRKSRSLMFAVSSLWIALILVVGAFEGSRAATQMAPRPQPSGLAPAQEAAVLAEMGDYEGAWRLYDEALQAAPEDAALWYALGVTLSRLDQRQETEAAVRYVVDHGKADSEGGRRRRQAFHDAGPPGPGLPVRSSPGRLLPPGRQCREPSPVGPDAQRGRRRRKFSRPRAR